MPRVVQFRRGTTAQVDSYTGAEGEIVIDLEKKTIRIHDGSVIGGHPMLSKTENEDLLAQMATFTADAATLTTTTSQLTTDLAGVDGRVTTLETTEFWKIAADTYYASIATTYTKSETDSLLNNEITNLQTTISSDYALSSSVYTKVETNDLVTASLADFATTSNLTQYRLVSDSYSVADLDTKFTDINLTYYSKADSDTIFRRLDDSKSAAEVDQAVADLTNNTFDRGYINSTFATISGTYSRTDLDAFFRLKDDSFSKDETLTMIEQNSFKGGKIAVINNTSGDPISGVTMQESDTQIEVAFIGTQEGQVEIIDLTTTNTTIAEVVATETDTQIEISFIQADPSS